MVGRETGKRRVARLLTGDVASASHVMMGRVHSHARIALLAGPRAAGPVKRVAYLSLRCSFGAPNLHVQFVKDKLIIEQRGRVFILS